MTATTRLGIGLGRTHLIALACVLATGVALADSVRVEIDTERDDVRANALAHLGIAQAPQDDELDEARVRVLHARARQEIERALQPLGFYRPRIDADLQRERNEWVARYVIDAGPPLRLDKVDVQVSGGGAADEAFTQLLDMKTLRSGRRLLHAEYDTTKRALLHLAAERGYFDARLLHNELRIDLARYRADVILHMDTGPRYRFGPVRIEQELLDDDLLTKYVNFRPGDPYSNATLLELQSALNDSQYFQRVDVRPLPEQAVDGQVPIEVTLMPRPRDKYTLGLGYGTDTGPRGKLGWERRYLNSAGHRLATELELSQIRSTLGARYLIPIWNPRTDRMVFSVSYTDDHPLTSYSRILNVGAGVERARRGWRQAVSLNYRGERFSTGEDEGQTALLMPEATAIYVSADHPLQPQHGYRWQIQLRGGHENFASDITFWQTTVGHKYIYPTSARGRVIARADAGYTATREFENLPASLRFYAGGSQSVRGYAYQALGPTDDNGKVVGGRYLNFGSIEYDHRVWREWSVAAFYDAGRAYNDTHEPFARGAGVGLRWNLPIGLLQLDAARPIDDDKPQTRLHISIGLEL